MCEVCVRARHCIVHYMDMDMDMGMVHGVVHGTVTSASKLCPPKGGAPVSISTSVAPSDHTSHRSHSR